MENDIYQQYMMASGMLDFTLFRIIVEIIKKYKLHIDTDDSNEFWNDAEEEISILEEHSERVFHLLGMLNQEDLDLIRKVLKGEL